jgi:hypothetical protein
LQDLIEEKGLYPVTVLFRVKGHIKDKLVEAKISTVKELVEKDLTELKELTKLSEKDLVLLKKDSSELIGN